MARTVMVMARSVAPIQSTPPRSRGSASGSWRDRDHGDGAALLLDGHRGGQDGQVVARHHRRAHALKRAGHEQHLKTCGETAEDRAERVDDRAAAEHPPVADQIAEAAAHQQRAGQREDEDGEDPRSVGGTDAERGGESGNDRHDGREAELDQCLADADGEDGGASDIDGAGGACGDRSGRGGHPGQCTLSIVCTRRSQGEFRGGRRPLRLEDAMAAQVTVYSNVG